MLKKIVYLVYHLKLDKRYENIKLPTGSKAPFAGSTYKNPHWEKTPLSYLLYKYKRAGLKTDNHPTADFDFYQIADPTTCEEVKKRVKKLTNHLGFPYIRTPSGGIHIIHNRIKGQPALNSSNIYFLGKNNDRRFAKVGDFKAKSQYIVHPYSEGYEVIFPKNWEKKKKRYEFLSAEKQAKLYARFGFYFSNEPISYNSYNPSQDLRENFWERVEQISSRIFPRIEGEVEGRCLAVNEVRDKNFRQVVIQSSKGLTIPALFNCESGEKMLPYLDRLEMGEVQSFCFKKGEKGSFLKTIYPLSAGGGNYANFG